MRWPRTRPRAPSTRSGGPATAATPGSRARARSAPTSRIASSWKTRSPKLCDAVSVAQGAYDNVIAADPTSPNVVWAGGIDLFRSTDGGITFVPMSSGFEVGQPQYLPPEPARDRLPPLDRQHDRRQRRRHLHEDERRLGGLVRAPAPRAASAPTRSSLPSTTATASPSSTRARSSPTTRPIWAAPRATARQGHGRGRAERVEPALRRRRGRRASPWIPRTPASSWPRTTVPRSASPSTGARPSPTIPPPRPGSGTSASPTPASSSWPPW